jgi:hypothetical protein
MGANSCHSQYDKASDFWRTIRDVMLGERAVKAGGARYVPRLEGQTDGDFQAFVERSYFYGATARTVSGYLGMIFRRDPAVKLPETQALHEWRLDADLLGKSLEEYAREVAAEVVTVGRCGSLVDWEDSEGRAYCSLYKAEDILNWREERIQGRLQLTLVVLREVVEASGEDGFSGISRERIRVLRLVPGADGWEYQVELWRPSGGDQTGYVLDTVCKPTRRGRALPNIPFVFHGPAFSRPWVEGSPIADIVTANLYHYRLMTDFQHGMHFTALPTAWVSGFSKDTELRIGSSAAWVTDQLGATAGFLEFKGEGLNSFEKALDRVERLLSVLGARLLESQRKVSESAEALQLRQSGESSVVAGISLAVSKSLCAAMRWVCWWHGNEVHPDMIAADHCFFELNRDFDVVRLSGKEIQALVLAWQAGAISHETMLHQFERGSVLPPGRSADEERALISQNPPPDNVAAEAATAVTTAKSESFG